MPTVTRILCPVDLSEASRRAFNHAIELARLHEAELSVVQVIDAGAWSRLAEPAFEVTDAMRSKLEDELGWWAARGLTGETGVVTLVREGPVVPTILAAASDIGADLIVIGSHGRGGFERLTIGSVTEKVLRKAACPVLVVPAADAAPVRVAPLRRVVCATDFSRSAARAVDCARVFADTAQAPLSLLTVVDWPFGETTGGDPVSQLRRSLHQEAAAQLDVLARRGVDEPPAEIVVREGKPGREILAFATEARAELIVLGVSGRGAVDLAVLGSTAHHVLRGALCPVLTVPAQPTS